MGNSAARATDDQKCPLSDLTKPHVGGRILLGVSKVLIGG